MKRELSNGIDLRIATLPINKMHPRTKNRFLTLFILLAAMLNTADAQQVILSSAQALLQTSDTFQNTNMTLEILRRNSGPVWQPNQCFQFYVSSPYTQPSIYNTFVQSIPPVCTSLTEGVVVDSCEVYSSDTLNIVFKSISTSASANQSIRLKITNFFTPFSSQILRTLNIRGYDDALCQNNMRTIALPSITIQQAITPAVNVNITSSSNVLGVSTSSNTLIMKFKPKTTMSPSGSGNIEIGVPYWYEIGNTGQRAYNPTASKKCSSDCMLISTSNLVGDRIVIQYESMLDSCIRDHEITISCRQYYNPITPLLTNGFSLNIYDNEIDSRIIEQTKGDLFLDARYYAPAVMPAGSFIIDPQNNTISSLSTWTLSLTVNIPMQTECYIRFYLPTEFTYNPIEMYASGIFMKKDLNPSININELNVIYRTEDGTIPKSSIVFPGCNADSSLGKQPFGRIDITEIRTQSMVKDSDTFEITIYKDKALTQVIAVLAPGSILRASSVVSGILKDLKMYPTDFQVQRVSDIIVTFKTANDLSPGANMVIRLPYGLSIPETQGNKTKTIQVQINGGSLISANVSKGEITIPNLVAITGNMLPAGSTVNLTIKGVQNQNSAKDAGDFTIITQNLYEGKYYVVDEHTSSNSFVATTGKIVGTGPIEVDNPTNGASQAVYTFKFTLEDGMPKSAFVEIVFPESVLLKPSSTKSTGSCRDYTCNYVDQHKVRFLIQEGLNNTIENTLVVGGVMNPRSFKPTGEFTITTYDTDGIHEIDTGFKTTLKMTNAASIQTFDALQSNFTNGVLNTYTFALSSQIDVIAGDKLQISLPVEIKPPQTTSQMSCKPVVNIKEISCSVIGQTISATLVSFERGQGVLSWTVSGIKNAASTKPTSDFSGTNIVDKEGFIVSALSGVPPTITNKTPASLNSYSILQESLKHNNVTTYTINFTPVNALPANASILINYPSSVVMTNGSQTVCTVQTTSGKFENNCVVDPRSRSITIKNVFANSPNYQGLISVTLLQVQNPSTNKPGSGFVIQTYSDQALTFIQDKLSDFLLQPQFECNYPCLSCLSSTQKDTCTSCWQGIDDPRFLMFYPNGTQTCRPYCDAGYTTNGSPVLNCQACDVSCATCQDIGLVGDVKQCDTCSLSHPKKLSRTKTCLTQCELGMFESTNSTCGLCTLPCEGCAGKDSICTQCFKGTLLSNLFYDQCIKTCPIDYVSMDGICNKCESPCATCSGTPYNCDTCDGSGGTKFTYQQRCWKDCPPGSGPDSISLTCFKCELGCDLCDIVNKTKCLQCTAPRVVYDGGCLDECPEGTHINVPDGDGTACRPWKLGDLGILYFPYLICGLIFIIICLFGLHKKRAYLSKGKAVVESPQRIITCIIVALAPLQFLATITQWILSYVYGTNIFAILAAIVTLAAVIINVAFAISFQRKFNTTVIPVDKDRRVRLGKMTIEEAQKFRQPIDPNFNLYKRQHRCTAYIVFVLTTSMTYKFNKLFYSFFYDLKMFQARFSQTSYYRKMMTTYHIVSVICIDLALICIDITCLTMIEDNNQLWVTVIETLVLSLLSIILGSIELFLLKKSLLYTEDKKKEEKLGGIDSNDSLEEYRNPDMKWDKDKMTERRLLMDDLIKNVKHNRLLFLNNKLDELLGAFGDRKCRSMLDLGTGWNLEEDPRMVITWPVSPMLRDDYAEMGEIIFTKEDAYGLQGNNVYADVKSKFMGMDFGTQDDAGFLEFQDALNRKHGGLMSQQENDMEELRLKRKKRRRGRKNKYYTQIDHEDDQEGEIAEASDQEEKLQVIKEQEEEEKDLRKQVKVERQKQQETAQQRKKVMDEAIIEKQRLELDQADARKRKAHELECQAKDDHQAEILAEKQAAINSKRLQDQYVQELAQKETEEKLKRELESLASAKLRAEYETQEAIRIKKEREEKVRFNNESELRRKDEIANEMAEKQQKIALKLTVQAEKDAQDLELNKVRIQDEERLKAEEREVQKRERVERNQALSPYLTEANETIKMADTLLNDFTGDKVIDVPPRADLRTFNENDILGELDRDEKGNIVVLKDETGALKDKDGNPTNQRGYLLDPRTGAVVENLNHQKMFSASELDERGELPQPFALEKFNFNAHNLMGDFDYTEDLKPQLMKSSQGFYIDKKGRRVNKHGWMTLASQLHLVDIHGRKKFDKMQLQADGDLPKLYNYQSRRFDIKNVMAIFEKSADGKIQTQKNKKGMLVDIFGRFCSDKGYLTDSAGNIIDIEGKLVWQKYELKGGEFPKIFPFTKFNVKRVVGDYDKTASGSPMLSKGKNGGLIDRQNRPVNQRGYLIDKDGNVIDTKGMIVFEKVILGKDGEIPTVYRTGVLQQGSNSDLSNLMAEIEKNDEAGDSSMDSQMEDSPAKYDSANQRVIDNTDEAATIDFDEDAQEHFAALQSETESALRNNKKVKKSKKKQKNTTVDILRPTSREKQTAGAYGGQAAGSIKRAGVKYDKDRLQGAQTFRVSTAEEPKLRAKLTQLIKSASGRNVIESAGQGQMTARNNADQLPYPNQDGFMGKTIQADSHRLSPQMSQMGRPDSNAVQMKNAKGKAKPGVQDFEEIFGKDIDQFLEDSDWDMASGKKVSQGSSGIGAAQNTKKVKQLEKQFKNGAK